MLILKCLSVLLVLAYAEAKVKPIKNPYQKKPEKKENEAYEKYRYPRNAYQAARKPIGGAARKVPQSPLQVQAPREVRAPVQENPEVEEVVVEELVVVEEALPAVEEALPAVEEDRPLAIEVTRLAAVEEAHPVIFVEAHSVVIEEAHPVSRLAEEIVLSILTIDPMPTTTSPPEITDFYAATVYETVTEYNPSSVVTVHTTITATYDRWE